MKENTISFKISWIAFSVIAIVTFVLLSDWMEKIGLMSFPPGFRHAVVFMIFLLNYILFGRLLVLNKYYKITLALVAVYLTIAFVSVPVSFLHYILGIFFAFLFVFVFILSSNIKTKTGVIVKILNGLIIILALMSIFSVFAALMSGLPLREAPTLFREGGALGAALNIGTILSISLYIITGEKKYLFVAAFFSFVVLLTVLKKSIISNFIIWGIYAITTLTLKGRFKFIILMLIVVALGYNMVSREFNENIKSSTTYYENTGSSHVRIIMYIVSFKIATDYFPFGSGMGTFASPPSIWGDYSKVYYDYGVANIGELSPRAVASGSHCLFDTYWPHILGELGFLGTILFLSLWLFPAVSSIKTLRNCNIPEIKGMSFYIIVIMIVISSEGFALYTPELAPFIFFHSGVAGLCYYHVLGYKMRLKAKESNENIK